MDFLRVIWKEFVLILKETFNCSPVGRKIQVDFWLNMAESMLTSTPSQNSNETIVKGEKVEIHKDKENTKEDNRFQNVNISEG